MNLQRLSDRIRRHEGYRATPYRDSLGLWTVGYGRLVEKMLIPEGIRTVGQLLDFLSELPTHEQWFQEDIADSIKIAHSFTSGMLESLSELRQEVIIEMAYQLGNNLHGFVNFRRAVLTDDHETAADEMINSRWAVQTPERARELAGLYRAG